jgi:peptidoglycan hydrolase-like amidase
MAEKGYSCREILSHYDRGSEVPDTMHSPVPEKRK